MLNSIRYVVDAHSCTEEKKLDGIVALESDFREEGSGSMVALHLEEEKKEQKIRQSYRKTQEKFSHHWCEAVD